MDHAGYASLFKALADDTRVKVVQMLTVEKRCACQILENLPITQPTLSHHMGILVDAGLVVEERRGKWVFYGLDPAKVASMSAFLATLGIAPAVCTACGE